MNLQFQEKKLVTEKIILIWHNNFHSQHTLYKILEKYNDKATVYSAIIHTRFKPIFQQHKHIHNLAVGGRTTQNPNQQKQREVTKRKIKEKQAIPFGSLGDYHHLRACCWPGNCWVTIDYSPDEGDHGEDKMKGRTPWPKGSTLWTCQQVSAHWIQILALVLGPIGLELQHQWESQQPQPWNPQSSTTLPPPTKPPHNN